MTQRMTVNQKLQLGKEVTPGTSVACNRLIEAFNVVMGPKVDVKTFRATGRRHIAVAEENFEYAEGKLTGEPDYAGMLYPLAMIYGAVTPTLHSPSSTVYDDIWTPPLTGATSIQSFTSQIGDSVEAEQYAYTMASGWGYKFTRKEGSFTADLFSQSVTTGASITSSPTNIALSPILPKHVAVYVDPTSGAIGTTQLTDTLAIEFAASGYYGQYWPLARGASFGSHLDMAPKQTFKLKLQANSTGVALLATYLQAGAKAYAKVDALGPLIDVPNSVHAEFIHEMALLCTDISDISDSDGVYAVEYTFEIAEDVGWSSGTAQIITLTNLLSAL